MPHFPKPELENLGAAPEDYIMGQFPKHTGCRGHIGPNPYAAGRLLRYDPDH